MSFPGFRPINWTAPSGVHALMTTRSGGVSTYPYDSFNLALHVDDEPDKVRRNRSLLAEHAVLPEQPLWLNQVHGTEVLVVNQSPPVSNTADAAYTQSSGKVLAVMVADCLPLLLSSASGEEIAVVHGGWRGLADGVIEAALACFSDSPAHAFLGPCICQQHYEVGDEVKDQFAGAESRFFQPSAEGKWLLDLAGVAEQRLREVGIKQITRDPDCSFGDTEHYYSYRRDGTTGRFAALIWREEIS